MPDKPCKFNAMELETPLSDQSAFWQLWRMAGLMNVGCGDKFPSSGKIDQTWKTMESTRIHWLHREKPPCFCRLALLADLQGINLKPSREQTRLLGGVGTTWSFKSLMVSTGAGRQFSREHASAQKHKDVQEKEKCSFSMFIQNQTSQTVSFIAKSHSEKPLKNYS